LRRGIGLFAARRELMEPKSQGVGTCVYTRVKDGLRAVGGTRWVNNAQESSVMVGHCNGVTKKKCASPRQS